MTVRSFAFHGIVSAEVEKFFAPEGDPALSRDEKLERELKEPRLPYSRYPVKMQETAGSL
jgi:hypothetical protein